MSEKKKFDPTRAQGCAIKYTGSDLLVSAGAGSGKTATLINRIVDRLITFKEDISKKLIVTFTREAANELRSRVNTALCDAMQEHKSDKGICAHLSEQIVKLGSADICTIDSFCLKLVRAHFEQIGLEGGFRMADESEAQVLCNEAMGEIIDELFEKKSDDVNFLRVSDCFSSFLNEEKLKSELLSLYNKLITTKNSLQTLNSSPSLGDDFLKTPYGKVICTHLDEFLDYYIGFYEYALNEIQGCAEDINAFENAFTGDLLFAKELKGALYGGESYEQISARIASYSAQRLGNTKKASCPDAEMFKSMRGDFKDKLSDIKKNYFSSSESIIRSSYEKNQSVCSALYEILCAFDARYSKKKKQAGVCDFNDVSRYALELLYDEDGEPSSLAQEISLMYDEVYVDEYQDTNFIQDKIFYAISRSNRFLVGDIKQSIYRFRSAEPEIFSAYRQSFTQIAEDDISFDENGNLVLPCVEKYKNGASLFMSENFRCDKSVIDLSNLISDFTFGRSSGIPYQAEDALRFAKPDATYTPESATIYLIDKSRVDAVDDEDEDEDEEDEEILRREAELVATRIKQMTDNKERLANGKIIENGDITILLRGFKKPVELYIDALKRRGIDCKYKGDEHFFEKSEILLVLCLLNAIDNPLRDVYLAGAMRSSVFGFTLEDMIRIKKASSTELSFYGALKAYDRDDALGKKIKEFLEALQKYRNRCLKKAAHEVISMLYAETGILSLATEREKKSLYKLYDIARSYENGKYKGLYGFLRYVEAVSDSSSKEELGESHDNCVKLMSIHASKGLEFEVCFICGCGSKLNLSDTSSPIIYHRDLGVCAYVSRDRGIAKFNTLLRRCASLAVKRASVEEEMRMLYVAMTRARSRLIMTAGVNDPDELRAMCEKRSKFASAYSVLNPKSYMDIILQALSGHEKLASVEVIPAERIKIGESGGPERTVPPQEEIDEATRIMQARFDYQYPFAYLSRLPSKLSVSRLDDTVLDSEVNAEAPLKYTLEDIPQFVSHAKSQATSAERGTATHLFLQFCDYELLLKNGAEAELKRLAEADFISASDAKLVRLKDIKRFVNESSLFPMLLKARQIWRERRFNIMIDADKLTADPDLLGKGLQVLVQGVTDCIIEDENGKIILIDYKTDRVSEENYVDYLTEKYSNQLTYYREAVEKILGRPVDRAIIYSVPLGKSIEL